MCVLGLAWSCGDSFSGTGDNVPAMGGAGGEPTEPSAAGLPAAEGGGVTVGGAVGEAGAPGVVCEPLERRITSVLGSSRSPSIAWNGTGFGVTWQDDRDGQLGIYFALLDAQGRLSSEDFRISDVAGVGVTPSVVWTGEGYGVAWEDERDGFEQGEIYFRLLNERGAPLAEELRITNAAGISYWPSLVWNGTSFGLAWSDTRSGRGEIYFASISAEGEKLGEEAAIITSPGNTYVPALIRSGNGYALAYNDDSLDENFETYFVRLAADGSKVGTETRLSMTEPFSQLPRLAATQAGFAVAWEEMDGTAGEVLARTLDATGKATGVTHPLSTNIPGIGGGDLAWSESTGKLGVVWSDIMAGTDGEVFFARFDQDFAPSGAAEQVTSAAGDSDWARLVELGGQGWAMVFEDSRDDGDMNEEIYFARLCP
jgi:hypothetical protein